MDKFQKRQKLFEREVRIRTALVIGMLGAIFVFLATYGVEIPKLALLLGIMEVPVRFILILVVLSILSYFALVRYAKE